MDGLRWPSVRRESWQAVGAGSCSWAGVGCNIILCWSGRMLLAVFNLGSDVGVQMEVALYTLCLTPVQSARSKAVAYPLYPDALAIINAIAEAAGAPPATELMRRPPDPVRA